MRRAGKGCLGILLLLLVAGLAIAFVQARRPSSSVPTYIAMGSSFAAGAGLGKLEAKSPWLCARSVKGYPQQLARILKLPIVDRTCGGATAAHVLHGGQFFQRAQLDAITRDTRLVTLTVGGNDVGYIGDLSMLAARRSGSSFGKLVGSVWGGPSTRRDWVGLQSNLESIFADVHAGAPKARVVVATYPAILPPTGTCSILSLSDEEAVTMRAVGDRLADVTRRAAAAQGVILVDMHRLGAAHHACSKDPWTFGWTNAGAAPFHPTEAGAEATARAIADALGDHQQL